MTKTQIYDLHKRIFTFVIDVINTCNKLQDNRINNVFVGQLIRSSSSIGANYEEADGSESKKDFIYKMSVVKKEAKETKYWLQLLKQLHHSHNELNFDTLIDESEQLIRIISSIIIKSKS